MTYDVYKICSTNRRAALAMWWNGTFEVRRLHGLKINNWLEHGAWKKHRWSQQHATTRVPNAGHPLASKTVYSRASGLKDPLEQDSAPRAHKGGTWMLRATGG